MSLLNASLAAGILLVALPIVLHLIMRQRPKYLRFPALRFIQKRREANRRQVQLRHLLLLLLRCAAIALFALALARPSITGSGVLGGKEGAPIAAALVFDTSPRMAYRQENLTRLERAQELADWLLSRFPPETAVSVIGSGMPQRIFAVDHGAAAQQVEHLTTSAASPPLHEAVIEAIQLVRTKPEYRHEIYIFSDLSEAAWTGEALESVSAALGEDEEMNLYMIDVGATRPQNVGITKIRLSDDVVAKTAEVTIEAELVHAGRGEATDVELFVTGDDGNSQKRGQQRVTWDDSTATVSFAPLSGLAEGTHQGMVRIGGQDALASDDVQYFTVEVRPPPAVLLLVEEDRRAVYLRQALAPSQYAATGRARFQCDVLRFDQATGQMLANYAAVCLLDPPPLSNDLWNDLGEYAANGGGVAIFLGHQALGHLEAFNAEAPQGLLAGPLARTFNPDPRTYLSPETYDHPAFARLRPRAGNVPWSLLPVFKYWEFSELHAGAVTVAPYANGWPAIVERPVGNRGGRAITMTTPVSHFPSQRDPEPWNLLPVGIEGDVWPFVILMQDLVGYLAGTGENQLNYSAGETVTLNLSQVERMEVARRKNYVVRTPSGESLLQSVRSGEDTVVFSSTEEPGNYQILAGGRTGALKRGFSVNLPPSTSRLERADTEQIAEALGEDRVRFARERNDIEVSIGLGRVGRELFPWMIGVLIVILAGEHLVANRFYKE